MGEHSRQRGGVAVLSETGTGRNLGRVWEKLAGQLPGLCVHAMLALRVAVPACPRHGQQEAAGAPAERCWRSLHSGTEEAHGGAGPALLLACGGRARGGNAPHGHPDHQGAAEEQRHRRTLQGPGGHAAKVGWPGLQHRALLPRLGAKAPLLPGGVGFSLLWFGFRAQVLYLKKGNGRGVREGIFFVPGRFDSSAFCERFLSAPWSVFSRRAEVLVSQQSKTVSLRPQSAQWELAHGTCWCLL